MKWYLHVGKQPINGYTNSNLLVDTVDFDKLDGICEASECTEMILDDMLHYIDLQKIYPLLAKLITRLRRGGKMIITSYDINEIVKSYINGIISIADLNIILFSSDRIKKISCYSHTDIQSILASNNLNIESVELNSGKFIITAKRI